MTNTYKSYLKRFLNGEQFIAYKKIGKQESIEDIDKIYYWESRLVYNILLPFYDSAKLKGYTEKELLPIIDMMIPFQKEYNNIKNKKQMYLDRIAFGVLAVEDGSVDIDNLEEEGLAPGKIIVYRQGSAPPSFQDKYNISDIAFMQDIESELLKQFYEIAFKMLDNIKKV